MKTACMIVQNYYDVDPRVRRKAQSLISAGYEVDVIALQPPERKQNPYVLNDVTVYGIPLGKRRASLVRYLFEYFWFFIRASYLVNKLMKNNMYDIIDINTLPDFLVFAAIGQKRKGAKVFLDLHESMPEFYQSKFEVSENNLIIRLLRWQEKLSINFSDWVLTIHKPMQAIFEKRGLNPDKTTILTNSADPKPFQQFIEMKSTESNNPFVFMYHGTLTRLYGLDIAVNAFSIASEDMPGAEFWIIGDGPEMASLQEQINSLSIRDRIKLIGRVPKDDIPEWLAKCNAGVLPTRKDIYSEISFSNKLPEYIIMRKPVLLSRLKTIRHYFRENSLLFFEPENVNALAENMIRAFRDHDLRSELVDSALEDYNDINWATMSVRYISAVRKLTNNGNHERE